METGVATRDYSPSSARDPLPMFITKAKPVWVRVDRSELKPASVTLVLCGILGLATVKTFQVSRILHFFVLLSCFRLAIYCISLFCYLDYFIVRGTAANQFSSNFSKNVDKWYVKTKLLEVGSLCPSQHATIHGIQHCIQHCMPLFMAFNIEFSNI